MIRSSSFLSFKKIILWTLIIIAGILTVYLGFLSLISLWIGLENSPQPGFWVPIAAGIVVFISIFFIFIRTIHILLNQMKEDDSIQF